MNRILVPIKDSSLLSLSASYFAIEFAKRKPAKILFLIFSPPLAEGGRFSSAEGMEKWQKQFDGLIQQGRGKKIEMELYFSHDEYFKAVAQFAQEHNITQIIIAIPHPHGEDYNKLNHEVDALRNRVECQLVTVRPREEAIS
jgi:hypothetical protein